MKDDISTNNINEATFYLLSGGIFERADEKILYLRKYRIQSQSKSYFKKWHVHIKNVPLDAIDTWWKGTASWNIRDFMEARDLLKKRINIFLHEKSTGSCESDKLVAKNTT